MAMTYSSLVGAKGATGSLMTWSNYSKVSVDVVTILDEAQALLWTLLRTREMRSIFRFTMPISSSKLALPALFLDPIGKMYCPSFDMSFEHKDEAFVQQNRNYNETNGSLATTNPFTSTIGSNIVGVFLPNHTFTQESIFYTTGATAFNGITPVGTFPVDSIVDSNNFNIDISILGTLPSASGQGGGSLAVYTCDILVQGSPLFWAIWDEAIHFDAAFDQQQLCEMLFYRSLPLLSLTNQSNVLTNRYPFLLRQACITQVADWMKEGDEYQKCLTTLQGMVERVSAENDMVWRGMDLQTETP